MLFSIYKVHFIINAISLYTISILYTDKYDNTQVHQNICKVLFFFFFNIYFLYNFFFCF